MADKKKARRIYVRVAGDELVYVYTMRDGKRHQTKQHGKLPINRFRLEGLPAPDVGEVS